MNPRTFRRTLTAVGLTVLIGAVGAQTYYTRELARRVASQPPAPAAEIEQAPAAGRWDPWAAMQADMQRMQTQMDRLFAGGIPGFRPVAGDGLPPGGGRVTLDEQGDDYVVKAEIPGASESDIDVNLDGRLLSISSHTQGSDEQTAANGGTIRRERYASSFQRAFTLPGPVSAAGMQSSYRDGVLTVTIPKAG